MSESTVPRLTYLRIKNYRALRDVEFCDLTPLTMLIGPNGSGKSTVLDALAFLAEAVGGDLKGAWERRNRFAGMRTRRSEGDIEFEIIVTGLAAFPQLYYGLVLREEEGQILIMNEKFAEYSTQTDERLAYILSKSEGWHTHFKVFRLGKEDAIPEHSFNSDLESVFDGNAGRVRASTIANIGTVYKPLKRQVSHFIRLLQSYHNIHLTDDHLKGYSDAGPRERLSPNGDNLPNVLYYLHEKHPDVLEKIAAQLRRWVPGLADIVTEITSDERLLLRFKDAPFEKPLPAQYMSGGTMRLAALLTLLYEPNATGLLGLEEPENELHPHLLPGLAEELVGASEFRQLLVATHAPALLDVLEPEQLWILHRDADGYTQATSAADLPGIRSHLDAGSPLGYLWARHFFDVGNPIL